MAEEDRLGRRAERARLRQREQRVAQRRALLGDDQVAADDIGAGARAGRHGVNRGGVGAQLGGALEAAVGIAEEGFGAEIGAG
jgi:hypothetical protein